MSDEMEPGMVSDVTASAPEAAPADAPVEGGEAPAVAAESAGPSAEAPLAEPAAEDVPAEEPVAITPEYIEQLVQQRIAAQNAQPPQYMQQLAQQLSAQQRASEQQTALFNRMLQQAEAQTMRQRVEASRPVRPPNEAPVEEHLKYQQADYAWQMGQMQHRLEAASSTRIGQLESTIKELAGYMQQERVRAQQAQYQAQQQAVVQQLQAQPQYKWLGDDNRRAAVDTLYRTIAQNNPNVSYAQVAQMVAESFGLNGPSQQAVNAAQRGASQEALKQQRAAIKGRRGPIPAATGTSRSSAPPTDRANSVRKAMAAGAKFAPELLAAYGLDPNKH